MLKNLKNLEGVVPLSKDQQKSIHGGLAQCNIPGSPNCDSNCCIGNLCYPVGHRVWKQNCNFIDPI